MKILHLDSGMTWRGGQQQLYFLSEGLKNKGIKQHLVIKKESTLASRVEHLDLPVTELSLSSEFDLKSMCKLGIVIRRFQPDVVHTHDSRTLGLAALLKLVGFRFRIVASRRVAYSIRHNPLWKFKYSIAADLIVAVSNYVRNGLISDGVSPKQIEVVYDGVNILSKKYLCNRSIIRDNIGIKGSDFVIGCVGAFTAEKGQELLLRAFGDLTHKNGSQFRLVLVGDGPLLKHCKKLIKKLNIEDSVTLTGFLVDLDEIFPAFDLLVQPSLSEGLGSVLLSGMAYQIPICASQTGGIPEIVIDGETGVLFSPELPQNLTEAIINISKSPRIARHQAEQAYSRLLETFSVEVMVLKTLKVYSSVLKNRI